MTITVSAVRAHVARGYEIEEAVEQVARGVLAIRGYKTLAHYATPGNAGFDGYDYWDHGGGEPSISAYFSDATGERMGSVTFPAFYLEYDYKPLEQAAREEREEKAVVEAERKSRALV